jgi:hypothetical protein
MAPDADMVVDVPGFREADDRVDEEVGFDLDGRQQGELVVRPVHRVAGLEGDHPAPPEPGELGAQLGGGEPEGLEVVVPGRLDALDLSLDVDGVGAAEEVGDARVGRVLGAQHRPRLGAPVRPPGLGHPQHGDHHSFRVAQGERASRRELRRHLLRDVERDGDRPQRSVRERIRAHTDRVGGREAPQEKPPLSSGSVAERGWRSTTSPRIARSSATVGPAEVDEAPRGALSPGQESLLA